MRRTVTRRSLIQRRTRGPARYRPPRVLAVAAWSGGLWRPLTRPARTVSTSGLPARRYPGFWDNVAQCCGSAGVADFFLGMHALTSDPRYLSFALVVLDDIADRAVTDQAGLRWHNIEHTATPPELPAQTGWMQGAAGIGAALLRGYRVLTGSGPGPWLPSWPFPA